MTELHEFGGGVSQPSCAELINREIGEAADKGSPLAAKWQKACKKYEAALKSEAKTGKHARMKLGSGNAVQKALADLLKVKQEIDRFVLASKNSKQRPGEPFFVGMINFATR